MMKTLLCLFPLALLVAAESDARWRKFTTVTPCRIVDTRVATVLTCHPLNNACVHTISSVSAWIVRGDASRQALKSLTIPVSFKDQGGEKNGCAVPLDAKAAVLNVAISPIHSKGGHLRVWKYETARHIPFTGQAFPVKPPKASALNWGDDDKDSWISNSVTIGLCDPTTAAFNDCNEDVLIQPFGGSAVKLIVDVYGYYE